ncbi:MAG TPA: hypothetical protein PKD19_01840 [Candidatus Saccharibacteria bacterium]|nr:hypothetical protein [Candidatus Saccharibacteria bacterium]HMR38358.1 hypothetical protein [Candidatus Saccharibacteria bacterium]
MQLGGKPSKRSNSLFDEDFASGFEDSRFDKAKPFIKVFVAILVIAGLGVGGLYYFGNNNSNQSSHSQASTTHESEDSNQFSDEEVEDIQKFSDCTSKASSTADNINTSSSDFYKKLIANYDDWLACYDKYPDVAKDASPSKSSLELARKNAIDSSGKYKDTYLSSNSYSYTPSTYRPSYNSYSTDNSSSKPNAPSSSTPSQPPQANTVDVAWCSAKKSEVNSLYSQYQTARNAVDALNTKISTVDQTINQQYGGTGLTESQRQRARASMMSEYSALMPNLMAQQNTAKSKYDSAQREYSSKGCY